MTESEFNIHRKFFAETLACPFADNDFNSPINDTETMSYNDGIKSTCSIQYDDGGRKVLRKDLNFIGNVGTRVSYIMLNGGFRQYNRNFQVKIGGYPKNSVLDWIQRRDDGSLWLRKVISLKENNMDPIETSDNVINTDSWKICDIKDKINLDPPVIKKENPVNVRLSAGESYTTQYNSYIEFYNYTIKSAFYSGEKNYMTHKVYVKYTSNNITDTINVCQPCTAHILPAGCIITPYRNFPISLKVYRYEKDYDYDI